LEKPVAEVFLRYYRAQKLSPASKNVQAAWNFSAAADKKQAGSANMEAFRFSPVIGCEA